jgi:ATP synthase protein I
MAEDDDERLARLRSSLDRARAARQPERPAPTESSPATGGNSGISLGLQAGSEFVSAVVVGAGIGWVLDRILGTNPLFMIVFFLIGVAAGVWNVIRLTSPKGGDKVQDSRLSRLEAADKGLPRPDRSAAAEAMRRRNASGGTNSAVDADDDED